MCSHLGAGSDREAQSPLCVLTWVLAVIDRHRAPVCSHLGAGSDRQAQSPLCVLTWVLAVIERHRAPYVFSPGCWQ
ncbi:UNVERIFIED_CONTAM: hypothetical protein FKN15_009132 [Acipenser sinensis]